MAEIKRATAYKLWIKDICDGKFISPESIEETPYLETRNLKVSRVNIIATTVLIYKSEDSGYANLTLDDGSGEAIRVKCWRDDVRLLNNVNVGDLVNVIGRVRLFNNEIYLFPEIVKVLVDHNWGRLRKLELTKMYGAIEIVKPQIKPVEVKPIVQEKPRINEITINTNNIEEIDFTKPETNTITETERQKVLTAIEGGADKGIRILEVASKCGLSEEQTQNIIRELVKEGEVYHPKPGFIQFVG